MHFVAIRRPGRALLGLLTGLIASVSSILGGQPLSTAYAEPANSATVSSDVNGRGSTGFEGSAPLWTAPHLADYPFERVEPAMDISAITVAAAPKPAPNPDTLVDAGIASTYGEGDGFQGRRTACGRRFDTNVPQVAHKSLPCGTLVRVEDTASGQSVQAEVTDRGPYVRGRVVDLSWAAFSQLHPTSPDLLRVKVYVVGSHA